MGICMYAKCGKHQVNWYVNAQKISKIHLPNWFFCYLYFL